MTSETDASLSGRAPAHRRSRAGARARSWSLPLLLCVAGTGAPATAQEATNTPAATQPAVGRFSFRQKLQFIDRGTDPSSPSRDTDRWLSTTSVALGLRRDLSVRLDVPVEYGTDGTGAGDGDREVGLGDPMLTLAYRPIQVDLNPVDSIRFAFLGGVEIPSMDEGFSSESWDPFVGGVFTAIIGRHGINQAARYQFNTGGERSSTRAGDGPSDALFFDTSYLFRLSPVAYSADTTAATYLTFELNGLYERNGDVELLFGPGILYEARSFALEATIGFPIIQDVDERAETDLRVTVGARLLF